MDKTIKILQLEDQETDAKIIERKVRNVLPESQFLCVETRKDFLKALQEYQPDIVISDYMLPQFDGLSALELVKEFLPETPFIIVTGTQNEDIAVDCMKAGATDYVIKEHLKRLESAITNAIDQKRLRMEKKLFAEAFNESEERYRKLFEFAPIGIFVLQEAKIIFSNPKAMSLLGVSENGEIEGREISMILPSHHQSTMLLDIEKLTSQPLGILQSEDMFQRVDGQRIYVETLTSWISYNQKPSIQVIFTDITERKISEEKFKYLSYHDYLTGLYNRRFFEEELYRIDKSSNYPMAVIIGDVNGLKMVNDSFGHMEGDRLLINAGKYISMQCQPDDLVFRIGGDEFAVLLPNTTEEEARNRIRKMKEQIQMENTTGVLLSISFGLSMKEEVGKTLLEVITEAENDMYKFKLYESLNMRNKTIDIIMNALYEKSQREMLHSKRVSSISAAIATEMGFQKYEINKIRLAGLVHDIGKMGIDEKILNKPSRLDDAEWIEMKKHPEAGYRILASANEFSDLAHYILSHHERWDGLGYPRGLKGEESPLESRIIAVSDSYDAMTSRRAYKEAAPKEMAIQELKRCAGTQFDPAIVDIFINKVLTQEHDFRNTNEDVIRFFSK